VWKELVGVGLARRLALLFRAKANTALDRAEDPREVLDYSYERQLELLAQVRRGLADVATSSRRVELQANQLRQSADRLHDQAGQALAAGREDLAREALTRRSAALTELSGLTSQRDSLQADQEKLTLAAQRLQTKVEAFRTRKETIKATYTAAEAQTRIGEAVSGISEEMGDVGLAMRRAEDKTAQMQARASAIDGLLTSGALEDATAGSRSGDDIQAALDAMSADHQVDRELAELRRSLPGPTRAEAIAGTPDRTSAPSTPDRSVSPSTPDRSTPPSTQDRSGTPPTRDGHGLSTSDSVPDEATPDEER
jgi:phage shock protein A